MPKLPTIDERPIPQIDVPSPNPIIVPDSNAVLKATSELGSTLQKLGGEIGEIKQRNDYIKYSDARSKFYQQITELSNQVESSEDYTKAPEDFKSGVDKIKQNLLSELGDNQFSKRFAYGADKIGIEQQAKIFKSSLEKQKSSGLALANANTERNLDSYLRATDENVRDGLIKASINSYDAAIPLNEPNRAATLQKYTQDVSERFALARLNGLTPANQIAVLEQDKKEPNSNFVQLIPADKRIDLLEKAKAAQEQYKIKASSAIEEANKLKKLTAEQLAYDTIQKGGTINDLDSETWFQLDDKFRDNLMTMEKQKAGLIELDPIDGERKYNEYANLYATNPRAFANVDPVTIQTTVTPDKVNEVMEWRTKSLQGISAPATFSQENTVLNNSLDLIKAKPKDPNGVIFATKYREAVKAFVKVKGKDPTTDELENIANKLIEEVAVKGFLRTSKPTYKLTGEEELPRDMKDKIIIQARQITPNIVLTEDQIKQIYLKQNLRRVIQ